MNAVSPVRSFPAASLTRWFCCIAVVTVALSLFPSHAAAQIAPTKVAIANPGKIFNEIREKKDWETKMNNDNKTIQDTGFEKQQKIKSLQDQLGNLKADSTSYDSKNKELTAAKIDFEVWAQLQQAEELRQQKQKTKELFDKIVNSVAEVATQKGVDLVLADQHPELSDDFMQKATIDQVRALLGQRNVLYSTPQIDITQDVITAMDAKYASGK